MKKKLLRYISCITVCLLLIGTFSVFPAGAADADLGVGNMDSGLKSVIEALRYFDFIPDYYDYNTNPSEMATRADFVSAAAKLVGQTKYVGGDTYYYDIPQSFWAYNEICALTQMGVLNGSEEKLFKPNDKIRKEEAYKILLTLMGYKSYAEADGGYPSGYLIRAARIDLNDNVSSSEYVTLADMFEMLYNAMMINVVNISGVDDNLLNYTVSDADTLMSIYHDVYYKKGTVTGAEYITTDGNTLGKEDEVEIDGVVYRSDVQLFEKLGEKIKFFYKYDKAKDERRVVWAADTGSTDSLMITANNDAEFDRVNFRLKYYDERTDKQKEVSLSRGITVIYNGSVVNENIYTVFDLPRYTAKLVKSKSNDYTVAVVSAYENIVADKIDAGSKIVYDKTNPNKSVKLDSEIYEKMSIKMLGTTDMNFEDISVGNVLSVYMSQDKKYVEVSVNAEQVTGTVERIQNDGNGERITINSIRYFAPDEAELTDYKIGDNVVAYLDVNGEIAYIQKSAGTEFAAYLVKAILNDDAFANNLKIKMFTEEGKMVQAVTDKKLKIDGKVYNEADKELKVLNSVPTLAMIKTTKDGAIKEIDTPFYNSEYESKDSLTISVPRVKNVLYKTSGTIGRLSVVDTKTKFFVVPDESVIQTAADSDFAIVGQYQIPNDIGIDAETYKTRERIGVEQYVILRNFTRNNYTNEMPVVVDDITMALDDEGLAVECIEGYQGANRVSLKAKEGFSFEQKGIKSGMVVSVRRDNGGEVNDCVIYYDIDNRDNYLSAGGDNSSYAFRTGYAIDLIDGVLKTGVSMDSYDFAIYTNNVPVVVVDNSTDRNRIRVGTINEAKTYYNAESSCSTVVTFLRWNTPSMFIVYK